MAMFPKIQSPCPYKSDLAAVMDGDFCRMCKRSVIDLTAWSDAERVAFLKGCETEVCVSYRVPVKPALVAAAIAASVAALPAAAQDAPAPAPTVIYGDVSVDDEIIFVGGITKPDAVEFAELGEDPADQSIPELPVVYETPAAPARVRDAS